MGRQNIVLLSANATPGSTDSVAHFVFNNGLRVKSLSLKYFYMPDTLGLTATDILLIDVGNLPVDGGTIQPRAPGTGVANPSATFVIPWPDFGGAFRYAETFGFIQKFDSTDPTRVWEHTTITLRINGQQPTIGINQWVMILQIED
jgi:hypothetical protein